MPQAKHTSGPWIIRPEYSQENRYTLWDADDNYPVDVSVAAMDANAALMAAAPDLLAALKSALVIISQHYTGNTKCCDNRISDIRRAIKKATPKD